MRFLPGLDVDDVDSYAATESSSKLAQCVDRGNVKARLEARNHRRARFYSGSEILLSEARAGTVAEYKICNRERYFMLLFQFSILGIGGATTCCILLGTLAERANQVGRFFCVAWLLTLADVRKRGKSKSLRSALRVEAPYKFASQ